VPLGPFLAKILHHQYHLGLLLWMWSLLVLAQNKIQVHYPICNKRKHSFDIHLEAAIQPENAEPTVISKSNFKYMYWTMSQQQHTIPQTVVVNSGDMMGSGTISGPTPNSYGSMLELT
jgi:fumarylacetoacetase